MMVTALWYSRRACQASMPSLTPLTAAMVRPFAFLDKHWLAVRRHGYLIVAVGERA